jgi:AcrR family transcriptional regulator
MNRRDLQKSETLRDILRSAEELFLEQGFEKTPMRQIAEHAGLTKGALYHHFVSKEELFERICGDHSAALLEAVLPVTGDPALSAFDRFRKCLELYRGMGMSDISFVSEFLTRRGDEGNAFLRERLTKHDRAFYLTVIAPILREGREKGEWNFASSPEILAVFLHHLNLGVNEEIDLIFSAMSEEAEKRIREVLGTYVYALSRIINVDMEKVSLLLNLEESLHLYHALLKAGNTKS